MNCPDECWDAILAVCGKINFRMDAKPETVNAAPPRLIGSVVAGFNTITSHIYLILFPMVLDLLLWFGPHLRVKTLMEPAIGNFITWLTENNSTPDLQAILK